MLDLKRMNVLTLRLVRNQKVSMSKLSTIGQLWQFLRQRKKYWLMPIVFFLILLGGLIVLTKGSALAPFIYAIF